MWIQLDDGLGAAFAVAGLAVATARGRAVVLAANVAVALGVACLAPEHALAQAELHPPAQPSWAMGEGPASTGQELPAAIWEGNLGYEEARQQQFLAGPVEHTLLVHAEWAAFDGAVLAITAGPVWNVSGEPGRNGWLVGVRLRWMLGRWPSPPVGLALGN